MKQITLSTGAGDGMRQILGKFASLLPYPARTWIWDRQDIPQIEIDDLWELMEEKS